MGDLKTENIVSELNLLLLNIPSDLTLIEKVRWLYIKTGKLFCYDYRIADNVNVAYKLINFENNKISKYQTCLQISYLFNLMLNYIDPNLKANVIERKLNFRGTNEVEHHANEIIMPNGEKYIIDLTLDLYLIQSGCQTKHFCFETDMYSNYDILPLRDIKEMDEKLGLIDNGIYTDKRIEELKEKLNNYDYSNMSPNEIIDFKIKHIKSLMKDFSGYHEGIQYMNKLFSDLLDMEYKEFNLTYKHNDMSELIACFVINNNGVERWVIYSNKLGLVFTTLENINNMLNNGWESKSSTLSEIRNRKYNV